MEDNAKLVETLIERLSGYGKTSYELAKLKALDKAANVVSTIMPHVVVLLVFAAFMLFLSLGMALWLGCVFGNIYLGFFAVAGFWAATGATIHFLMHEQLKKAIGDSIVKQALK